MKTKIKNVDGIWNSLLQKVTVFDIFGKQITLTYNGNE